jgi:hypothetical protein
VRRAAFIGLLTAALPVWAGQVCEPRDITTAESLQSLTLAKKVEQVVDKLDDDVLLIARVGQDLSKYGLYYSHMGFLVKDHPKGRWSIVHKLNECGTATSAIFDEGLTNFFSDNPVKLEGGLWRLKPEVQARLKRVLLSRKVNDFNQPAYSMVAYPFSEKYQNSNGWVLEVLAFGLAPEYEADTRKTAQSWLKREGYVPTTLELGAGTRLGARISKANVAFDDHPDELRWNGKIQTVTVRSVIDWLEKEQACRDPECATTTVRMEKQAR